VRIHRDDIWEKYGGDDRFETKQCMYLLAKCGNIYESGNAGREMKTYKQCLGIIGMIFSMYNVKFCIYITTIEIRSLDFTDFQIRRFLELGRKNVSKSSVDMRKIHHVIIRSAVQVEEMTDPVTLKERQTFPRTDGRPVNPPLLFSDCTN
jgi:hypothetical protein